MASCTGQKNGHLEGTWGVLGSDRLLLCMFYMDANITDPCTVFCTFAYEVHSLKKKKKKKKRKKRARSLYCIIVLSYAVLFLIFLGSHCQTQNYYYMILFIYHIV